MASGNGREYKRDEGPPHDQLQKKDKTSSPPFSFSFLTDFPVIKARSTIIKLAKAKGPKKTLQFNKLERYVPFQKCGIPGLVSNKKKDRIVIT